MSLFPEIRDQLRAAAARQATAAAPRRHRRRSASADVLAVAVSVALVVAVAIVFFGVRGSSRQTGASPASHGKTNPEAPLLRILAVLRRPQTKADLPTALVRALERQARPPLLRARLGQPDLAGVRLAAVTPAGEQVFLVPYRPPTAAAISAAISKLPASRRAIVGPRWRALAPHSDTLGIQLVYHGQGGGGGDDATAARIERQGTGTWSGGYKGDTTEVILVVPDGVAKVALPAPRILGTSPTFRFTAPVHNNVAVVSVRGPADDPLANMIWYGLTGKVIRRIPTPAASSACSSGRRFRYGQPPRSLTAVLGSLGRPAAPGQRISQKSLRALAGREGSGIYVRYSRAGQSNGVRYYLIPMSNVGVLGCTPGVQLITKYGQGEAHSYLSMSEVRGYVESGSDGNDHFTITPLVVPDGVATVTANYPAENQVGHVAHQAVTKRVRDNIVIFRITGGWDPPSLTYRTAAGAAISPHASAGTDNRLARP